MKKGLLVFIVLFAVATLFISCSGRVDTELPDADFPETTTPKVVPPFPADASYPDWIPEEKVKEAFYYALFAANQKGYDCGFDQNLIDEDNTEAASCFCEDGVGFCMYPVEAGMSQREFLIIGTSDGGKNWHVSPETVHVTTYLGEPQVGEYVYIPTGNDLQINDTLIVAKRDGTDLRQIDVETLIPEKTLNELEPDYFISIYKLSVKQDKNVSFDLCIIDRETSDVRLHVDLLLDKDLQPTWE